MKSQSGHGYTRMDADKFWVMDLCASVSIRGRFPLLRGFALALMGATLSAVGHAQDQPAAGQEQQAAAPAPAAGQKAASPAPSGEEDWLTGSVDIGYRWVTTGGNYQSYSSIINLGQGPRLFGLDFTIRDPKKRLFDRLTVRGYNWGGDPYNTAHVDAEKSGVYEFNADYRNIVYFNALPSFANPLAPGGFDEQSFDLHRRVADVDLQLLPGKHIVPYLMWGMNSGNGSGVGTWLSDPSNEYAVPEVLRDFTNNYRAGVRFEYNRFHVTLEEGGTTFRDDSSASDAISSAGDNTTLYLGQNLVLNSLQQAYAIRGDSIYSRGLLTATPFPWLTLTGQFLFSQPKTNVSYTDSASGNLAVLASFYSGLSDFGTGNAKQPHVTSNAGFELRPHKKLRIIESWMTDRYHDAGYGLLLTQFVPAASSTTSSPTEQVVNYNQEEIDAMFEVLPQVTLRGGYRYVWGDAAVTGSDLSQAGALESGPLRRDIALAGASWRASQKLRMNLDFERGLSDDVYFRTSLNDYYKARARAQYQVTPTLSLTANLTLLNNQNPAAGVSYYFQSQDESLTISWVPANAKRFRFLGEYDHTILHSDIDYLSLPFYAGAISTDVENAHTATSSIGLALPRCRGLTPYLEAGGSLLAASGSRPTRLYEPLFRLSLPLAKHVSWNTEWRWYGFGEAFYLYEGFRAQLFTTGLRITR
jgi:hypothetical protein